MSYQKKLSTAAFVILLFAVSWMTAPIMDNTGIFQLNVLESTDHGPKDVLNHRVLALREKGVSFSVAGKAYTLGLDEIGVNVDLEPVKKEKHGWFGFLAAFLDPTEYKIVVDVDEKKMQDALIKNIPDLDDPEKVNLKFYEGGLTPVSEEIGFTADYGTVRKEVVAAAQGWRSSAPIQLQLLPRVAMSEPAVEVAVTAEQTAAMEKSENDFLARTLKLKAELPEEKHEFELVMAEHREWFDRTLTFEGWKVVPDEDEIGDFLASEIASKVDREPSDAEVIGMPEEGKSYARVEGIARDGARLNIEKSVREIVASLNENRNEITLSLEVYHGLIINKTEIDLGDLSLLSVGRSNFAGSPEGRKFNILKALNEHYNNVLIAPGGEFSYVELLGGPVTKSNGWKDALAIFGGGTLRPVPGGGLCQVSTTVYRAAVYAGLDIRERRNHSLYVHYYIPYGEGLEATIYPGVQDLVFVNDTPNYILIQTYANGDDAFVRFYGTDDGRKIELQGPFRSNEVPEGIKHEEYERAFKPNELLWLQKITYGDGRTTEKQIISSYKRNVPRKPN